MPQTFLMPRSRAFRGAVSGFPTSGLVALWECNEATGNLVDVVASRELSPSESPTYHSSGKIAYAVSLGYASADNFATDSAGWFPSGAFTVNQWIKVANDVGTGTYGWSLNRGGTTNAISVYVSTGSDYIRLRGYQSSTLRTFAQATVSLSDAVWYMVTATRTAGGVHGLWCNSVELSLSDTYNSVLNWTAIYPFEIGYVGGGASGSTLDQLGIWNRVLTQTEIEYLYNSGNGIAYFI